jgi:3-methyladenine DNA glycosylase AlkD
MNKNAITGLAAELRAQVLTADDRTVPTLRRLRRSASHRLRTLEAAEVFRLAALLLSGADVPRWLVYELVHYHRGARARLTEARLRQLGRGLAGWGEVDAFACYLSGPAWREAQIRDSVVQRWAVCPDRWWRRVAVVSTVALNNTARGGSGDAVRTLALCTLVTGDSDDMVVKALSWALRELARKEPQAVRAFLRSNGDQLAARIVREVRNKLETGLKNPRAAARLAYRPGRAPDRPRD